MEKIEKCLNCVWARDDEYFKEIDFKKFKKDVVDGSLYCFLNPPIPYITTIEKTSSIGENDTYFAFTKYGWPLTRFNGICSHFKLNKQVSNEN
jgi:hypothetical protein